MAFIPVSDESSAALVEHLRLYDIEKVANRQKLDAQKEHDRLLSELDASKRKLIALCKSLPDNPVDMLLGSTILVGERLVRVSAVSVDVEETVSTTGRR